jgi:hypothetical protein
MKFTLTAFMVAVATMTSAPATAAPDCYDRLGLQTYRPAPARLLAVAIDETTVLTPALTGELQHLVATTIRPGDQISVILFSAFGRERHMREVASLGVDALPPADVQRTMPMARLRDLQDCSLMTRTATTKALRDLVSAAAAQASPDIARSEIVMAIREIGGKLKASPTARKSLVLVTDGMEHSTITSFYRQKNLRDIDATEELSKVQAKANGTDLGGAEVYIFGGGLVANPDGMRESSGVIALETFWTGWIKQSKGTLVAFGKPTLLVPIK